MPHQNLLQSVFSAMGKRIFDSAVVYDSFICGTALGDLSDASSAEGFIFSGNLCWDIADTRWALYDHRQSYKAAVYGDSAGGPSDLGSDSCQ